MALHGLKTWLLKAVGITAGDTERIDLAHRKRLLERELRDSGLSRAEARRITGAVMRQTNRT